MGNAIEKREKKERENDEQSIIDDSIDILRSAGYETIHSIDLNVIIGRLASLNDDIEEACIDNPESWQNAKFITNKLLEYFRAARKSLEGKDTGYVLPLGSPDQEELTSEQLERIDEVDNSVFELMSNLLPPNTNLEWNAEWICPISELLAETAKEYAGVEEINFYPYTDLEPDEPEYFSLPSHDELRNYEVHFMQVEKNGYAIMIEAHSPKQAHQEAIDRLKGFDRSLEWEPQPNDFESLYIDYSTVEVENPEGEELPEDQAEEDNQTDRATEPPAQE